METARIAARLRLYSAGILNARDEGLGPSRFGRPALSSGAGFAARSHVVCDLPRETLPKVASLAAAAHILVLLGAPIQKAKRPDHFVTKAFCF